MYLLDTPQVMDLLSRDRGRAIFTWLDENRPEDTDLFVSVISLGQIAHSIEGMEPSPRNHWRRLLREGRRRLEDLGSVIDIDGTVVEVWASDLRGDNLQDVEGAEEDFGEDDRLVFATAIARGYSLVTAGDRVLTEISGRTALTLVEL